MKLSVVNNHVDKSVQLASRLQKQLIQAGFQLDESRPDIVISVGGDGTLLSAFHRYAHLLDSVRFIGIHTGHLGFYTDWREYELDDLVESLLHDQGQSVSYPLLDVDITYSDGREPLHFVALNEATLKKFDGTLVCDVLISNEILERFRGDGMCVATPTGSTGYNKSVGGGVIHPRLDAIQLTEIASLNNRLYRTLASPAIIPADEWITLKPHARTGFVLTIDHLSFQEKNIKEIKFKVSKERIHFARYRHTHFWTRVQDAFIGDSSYYEN